MVKKYVLLLMILVVPVFLFYEEVSASNMNSKAGITFSNSYNPSEIEDPLIPDGSKIVVNISDDRITNKVLPKTGGKPSIILQYAGLGLLMVACIALFQTRKIETKVSIK
ncbi:MULTISPECIES: LPXTG cell wall anchor domain-containing protein [Bacillus cereus group]|uniref:LPXTG-domain-containing protein cell wall anchor domain n=1 Tax=Bacillus cereus VD196 TaxID=1053243 RepID=A0A9W5Q2T1_BACCE|nr:LPXTG cell wall anchor domain-containing protein [Bacillus cereus]EOO65451.1 LPXTG-domain-containing protein cell wall anchor domain [Bacillus cereus VD196]MBM6769006.1 LPXTG cell wall anchor domain-containing protein [Bacillus cereus]